MGKSNQNPLTGRVEYAGKMGQNRLLARWIG
jgi:hypothetical protein